MGKLNNINTSTPLLGTADIVMVVEKSKWWEVFSLTGYFNYF
jgi:hypothetical protein